MCILYACSRITNNLFFLSLFVKKRHLFLATLYNISYNKEMPCLNVCWFASFKKRTWFSCIARPQQTYFQK